MSIRRVPGPTGEPFWDALLRRHPDLELVLLPPDEPGRAAGTTRPSGPALDEATLQAVRRTVRAAVDAVLVRVGVDVDSASTDLTERLTAGSARGSVSVHVRRVVPGGADEASPREVVDALREDRWQVTDHPGVVHRVVASRDDLPAGPVRIGVTVVVGLARTTGSLQIEAETADLPVGADAASALLREQREQGQNPAAGADARGEA